MIRKNTKKGISLTAIVFMVAVTVFTMLGTSNLEAGLKDTACEFVGCPNGSRPCADVGGAPLKYYCYENPPAC